MPEFVEAEAYRRTLDPVLQKRIAKVDVADARVLRRSHDSPDSVSGALVDATVDRVRRIGKVVFVDVSSGHTAALGFGLRGRLILDGFVSSPSGSRRATTVQPGHVRLVLEFEGADGGHRMELEDQLRLATLDIDIDEGRLGHDVMRLDKAQFLDVVAGSTAAIKSLLMDQRAIAGIGNLVADEILFQGKVDPRRPASDLSDDELDTLWAGLRRSRTRVLELGGSHRGVMIQSGARERHSICPRCGVEMERIKVGGRTSYFCPAHQI